MSKRCHDCGNPHLEAGGWCESCRLKELVKTFPKKMSKLVPDGTISVQPVKEETPGTVERRRGYNDAKAGHGPALFDGDYMIGYRRGRAEIGQPMEHKPASEPKKPKEDDLNWFTFFTF